MSRSKDPYGPPKQPIEVRCIHCDQTYSSDKMVWESRNGGEPLWWCGTPGCGGAGLGIDIYPSDSHMFQPFEPPTKKRAKKRVK